MNRNQDPVPIVFRSPPKSSRRRSRSRSKSRSRSRSKSRSKSPSKINEKFEKFKTEFKTKSKDLYKFLMRHKKIVGGIMGTTITIAFLYRNFDIFVKLERLVYKIKKHLVANCEDVSDDLAKFDIANTNNNEIIDLSTRVLECLIQKNGDGSYPPPSGLLKEIIEDLNELKGRVNNNLFRVTFTVYKWYLNLTRSNDKITALINALDYFVTEVTKSRSFGTTSKEVGDILGNILVKISNLELDKPIPANFLTDLMVYTTPLPSPAQRANVVRGVPVLDLNKNSPVPISSTGNPQDMTPSPKKVLEATQFGRRKRKTSKSRKVRKSRKVSKRRKSKKRRSRRKSLRSG